jgi:uroporphyrinogen-III decarboxylase
MFRHVEAVNNALNRNSVDVLPRGELFINREFLDRCFDKYKGAYVKQLEAVAQFLGLSLIGIDLNPGWSQSLLFSMSYKNLEEYFTVGCINGPIASLIEEHGFFNAMGSLTKNPSLFSSIATRLLRETARKTKLAHANGLGAIAITDDIAGNKGLFFPRDYFMEVVWPVYRKIAEIIKENGLFTFFHSDGDMGKVVASLIEAGYDCLHPIDTQAGADVHTLKQEFGERMSFMGHIDTLTWSEEHIFNEIAVAESEFKKGGLILGSTCGISMETVNDKLGVLYPRWKRE